ncbi:MAG: inositol monophosphatase [Aquificae bacterium]|nr:inositol monophosphatase [Aquificota bacterium]
MGELERLVRVAKAAALAGGQVLKEHFRKVKREQIEEKAEKDFVTFVDKTSEEVIREVIKAHFPEHALVGEEEGKSFTGSPYCWYLDPLDGTKNYLKGLPLFAVSVGVTYENRPVAGAVYLPYFDALYWAYEGGGAFKNGEPIRVSSVKELKYASVAYGFPSKSEGDVRRYWEAVTEVFFKVGSVRRPGAAAVDMCFLAEGLFDGMLEFEMKPWDVCAAAVILKEAGGLYETSRPLHEGPFDVVAGSPEVFPFLKEVYAKYFPSASEARL